MPEGDSIERARRSLTPLIVGHAIVRAECRWPEVVRGLVGTTCTNIEAHGKQMLIAFSDDTFVRVHLGMTGSWHRYDPGERWQRPREELGIALETKEDVVVCFKVPELERLTQSERKNHVALVSLGPDVLVEPFDLDEVVRRARHPDRADMDVADLLLDQRVAAGIGNIYKCESLFAQRLSPHASVASLDDDTLRALYTKASHLMRDSVASGRVPQSIYRARLCPACNARVTVEEQGDRLTWWCARCQRLPR
jgi:endonuclease VIII